MSKLYSYRSITHKMYVRVYIKIHLLKKMIPKLLSTAIYRYQSKAK